MSDKLTCVTLALCDSCMAGAGGKCHTPGCSLYLNRAPDISVESRIAPSTGDVIEQTAQVLAEYLRDFAAEGIRIDSSDLPYRLAKRLADAGYLAVPACDHPAQSTVEVDGRIYWACPRCGQNFGPATPVQQDAEQCACGELLRPCGDLRCFSCDPEVGIDD